MASDPVGHNANASPRGNPPMPNSASEKTSDAGAQPDKAPRPEPARSSPVSGTAEYRAIDPIDLGVDEPSFREYRLACIDDRERAMPMRQGDLTRLLLSEPGLSMDDRLKLHSLGRFLGAMLHGEFYDLLLELKERYSPLNPDDDYVPIDHHSLPRTAQSDEEFLSVFERILNRANYRPLPLSAIEQAVKAPNEMGLTYLPDFSLFEHLRVYVRGYTRIHRDIRSLETRFHKRKVVHDAYQRVVIALKFREGRELDPCVRSDVLYLRMFKDVPHVDMEMHLPEQGTKVRMRMIDKAQIASPIFMGLPTMAAKIFFASVFTPALIGGLLIAPITAGVNSFFGFHRAKQKHLYAMIHKLYYMSLANNASVLTRLIDSAEDEEYKEAMLAYYFLWRGSPPGPTWDSASLDHQIECFLKEKIGMEINFEIKDALDKLFRLGLAQRDEEGVITATPIEHCLKKLDRRWDATYDFVRDRPGSRNPTV